jgi:hypothetical protein
MHLHAVLRIEMIGSQESCGLQAQGWCGTHPGRVCICRAGKVLDSDDNGEGKLTERRSIVGAFAAAGLAEAFRAKGMKDRQKT